MNHINCCMGRFSNIFQNKLKNNKMDSYGKNLSTVFIHLPRGLIALKATGKYQIYLPAYPGSRWNGFIQGISYPLCTSMVSRSRTAIQIQAIMTWLQKKRTPHIVPIPRTEINYTNTQIRKKSDFLCVLMHCGVRHKKRYHGL